MMFYPGKKSENSMIIIFMLLLLCTTFWTIIRTENNYSICVNEQFSPVSTLSKRFLSFGLDTVEISHGIKDLHLNSTKLIHMTSLLGSGYIRLGGTMSDRLIFMNKTWCNLTQNKFLPFFTMSSSDFLQVNDFLKKTNFRLLFDINVLLREGENWDPSNSIELFDFSQKHNLDIDWQLGNEPNSFQHVFNVSITPHQLSQDFISLRTILKRYFPNSLLVGPDTTRPQPRRPSCVKYMKDFLSETSEYIDAIAWHQYYLNGHNCTLEDFWNPDTLDLLQTQIDTMLENINPYKNGLNMWLTETSSAYGGGAPGLSNTFSSSPLWLDKLGISALNGIQVVIRQSLLGGNYSVIDKNLNPLPDWWLSFLYKSLVGEKVITCAKTSSKYQRIYCHCASKNLLQKKSMVIYGVNLEDSRIQFNFVGTAFRLPTEVDEFILTAPNGDITSKQVLLNNVLLSYRDKFPEILPKKLANVTSITMEPYSLGFWVVHNVNIPFCDV